MNFVFGRKNLALTVFVPWDCKNHCKFCTSKMNYRVNEPDFDSVKYQMRNFFQDYSFPVQDVVFTGGEPMADVQALAELIDLVPKDKKIFINTTFTKTNKGEFLDLIDKGRISGVNISRHGETFEDDCMIMCDIAEDKDILAINCSVRINCVMKNQDVKNLVNRWKNKDVTLNLREDYTELASEELHNPYREVPMDLLNVGYRFGKHTQCNVCDTTYFWPERSELPFVMYHKGLQDSSILDGDNLEINDLIIDQTGMLRYDWRHNNLEIKENLLSKYKIPNWQHAITLNSLFGCNCNTICGGGCGGSVNWSAGCGGGC